MGSSEFAENVFSRPPTSQILCIPWKKKDKKWEMKLDYTVGRIEADENVFFRPHMSQIVCMPRYNRRERGK